MGEDQTRSFLECIGLNGWKPWLILVLVFFNLLLSLPLTKYPEYREQVEIVAERGQNAGYADGYEKGFTEGYAQGLSECAKGGEVSFEIGKEEVFEKGGGGVV